MSKNKFNFQAACAQMLKKLGATPNAQDYLVINSIAGPLLCKPQEDWLHCKFENVAEAKKLIHHGTLNPFSGKWNWHFFKPDQDAVLRLFKDIARVVDLTDNQLMNDYEEALAKLPAGTSSTNTQLTYMYKDGNNYKTSRTVTFSGSPGGPSALRALILACDSSAGNASIIPGEVGLKDLQDSFTGCQSPWDPEQDHPWHEITDITPIDPSISEELDAEKDERSFQEFCQQLCSQAILEGWDESYTPEFYPAMKQRFEQLAMPDNSYSSATREG